MIGLLCLVAISVCSYSIVLLNQKNKELKVLAGKNKTLSEALFLPPRLYDVNDYIPHEWGIESIERIIPGHFSLDTVEISTKTCTRCGVVHRHIIKGFDLAEKKGLASIEGTYKNGERFFDSGCVPTEEKKK